ncbi:hypothetical protein F511_39708 [Dorcoceras hygrometricum]|uniref:Uncharacterized protein n=1 Tax=Dorcoceras hygrometricum TaxID=472368 RepID=A0A2Z7B810_9LAMI|nr:hypothetical protein F511_39708 [Dorcoceras hygrometricum]
MLGFILAGTIHKPPSQKSKKSAQLGCELDSELDYLVESELVGVGRNCELVCFKLFFGAASSCYAANEHGSDPPVNFFSGTHKNSRTIEMASSSFTNAYLVDFDSVLEIPHNEGMQKMFKALETSGLHGFLGCKPMLYQSELGQFFDIALVQEEDITGAISGKYFIVTPSRESCNGAEGEVGSSSRRPPIRVERRPLPTPQPSPDVQGSGATQLTGGGSAVRTPTFPPTVGTFAERVAMAQRHIIESGQVISIEEAAERVIESDRRESDRLERERARERREIRLRRRGL